MEARNFWNFLRIFISQGFLFIVVNPSKRKRIRANGILANGEESEQIGRLPSKLKS